nr:MAG TPA: hypothetical protein [Caudoviricetes sp.]
MGVFVGLIVKPAAQKPAEPLEKPAVQPKKPGRKPAKPKG